MRRDDHALVSNQDVDLIVDCFEEHKEFDLSFYYSIMKGDAGKLFTKIISLIVK